MKFLAKHPDSGILADGLRYLKGNVVKNRELKERLAAEQHNFCAYTEKWLDKLDSVDVEHFDASRKYTETENYYNYYAVLHTANLYKKDEKYQNASFFKSRFFQDAHAFSQRIQYDAALNLYLETDPADSEAIAFIDFLGLNDERVYNQRKQHYQRMKQHFSDASYSPEDQQRWFRTHQQDLNFITVLEAQLDLDLSEFYT